MIIVASLLEIWRSDQLVCVKHIQLAVLLLLSFCSHLVQRLRAQVWPCRRWKLDLRPLGELTPSCHLERHPLSMFTFSLSTCSLRVHTRACPPRVKSIVLREGPSVPYRDQVISASGLLHVLYFLPGILFPCIFAW